MFLGDEKEGIKKNKYLLYQLFKEGLRVYKKNVPFFATIQNVHLKINPFCPKPHKSAESLLNQQVIFTLPFLIKKKGRFFYTVLYGEYQMYYISRFDERGRSMVEMLGVLAIIGVLTIGFVLGVPWAMDKWRAIRTIDDVRDRALACSNQLTTRNVCDLGDFDAVTSQGYGWSLGVSAGSGETFDITLSGVPMGVCKKIATSGWAVPSIYIGSIGPITSANCAELNDMTFYFSRDLTELSPEEGGDCPPGVDPVCPAGSGPNCQGPRIQGLCGCRQCYPCEGYTGNGYMTTCGTGRTCKSGGCVCDDGGCPAGQSNFCPDGSSWQEGDIDKCGDRCYICSTKPGGCEPSCPSGTGENCSGPTVAGECGATCHTCYSCEGYVGGVYRAFCSNGSKCEKDGCVCTLSGCPSGQSTSCKADQSWIKKDKDGCGNQCYECQERLQCPECQNGASCRDGACLCINGWSGDDCSECIGEKNNANMCCVMGTTACYTECCSEGLRCDPTLQKCVQTACPGNRPMYEDGTCQDGLCYDDTQCPVGKSCYQGSCVEGECRTDSDCTEADKPHCRVFSNPANNVCSAACSTPTTTNGNCPCNTDSDCFGSDGQALTPGAIYCRFNDQKCCSCRSDSDCPTGYCDGCACQAVACGVGSNGMTEDKCIRCPDFEWKNSACCPTANNDLNPFSELVGNACSACGGTVVDGKCVKLTCDKELSSYTTEELCRRCGGLWDSANSKCTDGECLTNADCGSNKYCGGSTASCYYPNYNTCRAADSSAYTRIRITHNGQSEVWYRFNNSMSWWDGVNACKAIGKSMPSKEVLYERWRALGAAGVQTWAWTSSSYNSCTAYNVFLTLGMMYYNYRTFNVVVLCR